MTVIGITTTWDDQSGLEQREYPYLECIRNAGCIPLLIPAGDAADADAYIDRIDGLLLGGGADIDPALYSTRSEPGRGSVGSSLEHDVFECALVHSAWEADMPILGICRGMQLLNVAFGGTLIADLAAAGYPDHTAVPGVSPRVADQIISITPGTRLRSMYYCQAMEDARESSLRPDFPAIIRTNSLHHQGIDALASDFIVCAHSLDGLAEGIECDRKSFVLGVQWHPEYLASGAPLFESFCQTARCFSAPARSHFPFGRRKKKNA